MALDAIPSLNLGCHFCGRGQILFLPLGVKDRDSSCTRLETDGPQLGRVQLVFTPLCGILIPMKTFALLSLLLIGCATTNSHVIEYPDGSQKSKVWICDFDKKDPSKLECFDTGPVFNYVCNLPGFVHGK